MLKVFQKFLILKDIKSYSDFAEWLDFAFWWSCIGNGGVASGMVELHREWSAGKVSPEQESEPVDPVKFLLQVPGSRSCRQWED